MYQIKDWDEIYENSRSRIIKDCRWVAIPNKQDGLGYSRLVTGHGNGAAHYGVWVAIVCLCSRQTSRRGYLTDDGTESGIPLTTLDISLVTRLPEADIEEALPRLVEVGWMYNNINDMVPCGNETALQSHSKEGNRTEEKRIEKKKEAETDKMTSTFPLLSNHYKNVLSKDTQGEYLDTKNSKRLRGKMLEAFFRFWEAFGYKEGLREAADSWLKIKWPEDNAPKNKLFFDILKAAKRENDERNEKIARGSTPKMPQGWLTARRWEDEEADG